MPVSKSYIVDNDWLICEDVVEFSRHLSAQGVSWSVVKELGDCPFDAPFCFW
jgi:hypothetical protein